ncbi:MAG: cytochrome c biogenesis protein CcsA, partial [Ignavibacteriales bacterium]|nr:cytochrome c biogenesis protein CcsA [Ignavibacteriales bacterium]
MLGNFFIIVAIVSCVLSIIFYYKSIQKEKFLLFARFSYYSLTFFTICASVYLLYLILTHQYQFNYVFEYSSNELTLGLLISSFFAGQEGSFLLWTLFASILGLFIIKSISKYEGYEERVMLVFSFTVLFLLVMINPLFKNPFTLLWSESVFVNVNHLNPYYLNVPFIQNNLFFDSNSTNYYLEINSQLINYLDNNNLYLDNLVINGNGLNPLLQNFWMQIHPPILFGGFALAGVIYSLTIGITLKNKFIALIKIIRPWLLTFLFVLGIGLITGAYWSYGVLGWGGYWGWDPVENSSLIPWLIGIAALHILIIKKSGSENENILLKTCVFLLISIYITVIYSTFLTR